MKHLLPVVLLSLVACRDGATTAPQATPPVRPLPAAPAAQPRSHLSLAERLAREASSRPDGAIRVEDLTAALARRGVETVRTRQVSAAPVGAAYCATALTRHGLGLAVCEFDTARAAEEGRARSRQLFDRLMPDRTLLVSGSSLLTITRHDDPVLATEAGLATESFAALGAIAFTKGE